MDQQRAEVLMSRLRARLRDTEATAAVTGAVWGVFITRVLLGPSLVWLAVYSALVTIFMLCIEFGGNDG